MNAIVFNTLKSNISPVSECTAFRAAYIFSRHATAAGDSGSFMINFEELLKRYSFDHKAKTLINNCAIEDPELSAMFAQLRSDLKTMNAIKHKNKKVILTIKHGEKIINTHFNYYIEHMLKQASQLGFIQLKSLSEKLQLYYLPMMTSKQEGVADDDPDDYNASTILKYVFEQPEEKNDENKTDENKYDKDEAFLFFLTPQFFDYVAKKSGFVNSDHANANNNDAIVSEHFFSLPNINAFSALELEAVRASLADIKNEWYNVNSEWIKLCAAGSSEILDFFKETIIPFKDSIQEKLDADDIIHHRKKTSNNSALINIYIGLVPIRLLYDFYFTEKVVEQDTMDIMNEYLKSTGKENFRVPFMVVESDKQENISVTENQNIKSIKKSLDID